MKNLIIFSTLGTPFFPHSKEVSIQPQDCLPLDTMYGNSYPALATEEMGAKEFEVWRASLALGSKCPKHVHETEEVFIVLKGHILAIAEIKSTIDCSFNLNLSGKCSSSID